MGLFRAVKTLFSREVVWRSGTIGAKGVAGRHAVIAKKTGDTYGIVLNEINSGERSYEVLTPQDAHALGQALIRGATACKFIPVEGDARP